MNSTLRNTLVTRHLDQLGISYCFFRHPGPVNSLEQAARERGQRPEQIIRSILFRLSQDAFILVLVAGPNQISWPALRQYLGVHRITLATPEEILRITGYEIGAVSPFGLNSTIRILADECVFVEEEISIGSGVRGSTIILRNCDLRKALPELEIGHFC